MSLNKHADSDVESEFSVHDSIPEGDEKESALQEESRFIKQLIQREHKGVNTFRLYYLFCRTIEDVSHFHVTGLFNSIKNVAEEITRAAYVRNETFPCVTVPMFEVVASQYENATGAESCNWGPVVGPEEIEEWVDYSLANQGWLKDSRLYGLSKTGKTWNESGYDYNSILGYIFNYNFQTAKHVPIDTETDVGPWQPIWQMSPPLLNSEVINYNMQQIPNLPMIETAVNKVRRGLFDVVRDYSANAGNGVSVADHEAYHDSLVKSVSKDPVKGSYSHPHFLAVQPVYSDLFDVESPIAGHVLSTLTWDRYLVNLLPEGVTGITAVVSNTCNQTFTYDLNGNGAYYVGAGDFHDTNYDSFEYVIQFYDSTDMEAVAEMLATPGHCVYTISIYPTSEFEAIYITRFPLIMTVVVSATFLFVIGMFFMYDLFVSRRNNKILKAAVKSNVIVNSLFPSNVRDRLFAAEAEQKDQKGVDTNGKNRLKSYLRGNERNDDYDMDDDDFYKTKPIADLFPETTVLFADISGFTAWSSAREPTQVFILLETIYKAFDDIAKARRVFKVETVGDCYVAVSGVPDPRKDHALCMARFAIDCMHRMHSLMAKLEVTLGPDTSDLDMRFGLHSGPVTAGVLRGDRSRFQLFGDTMNTASRMESNGLRGKIHISQETADLLIAAGKQHWIVPREDKIVAKGKGELQTYWLSTTKASGSRAGSSTGTGESAASEIFVDNDAEGSETSVGVVSVLQTRDLKTERLVQWNVEVLMKLLKKVVAQRKAAGLPSGSSSAPKWVSAKDHTVLDEVREIITLPDFDAENNHSSHGTEDVDLNDEVENQLKEFVSTVAPMYRENPFHNFEHASHVAMSVSKLLSRIVAPDVEAVNSDMEAALHNFTYGITSDPLTQFACVFSALIHDVDHTGIPNTQLLVENPKLAAFYRNQSIAEQNSVDLSWDLLQDNSFSDLRGAIYQTDVEMQRFRQLVVNSVMATDIMDQSLKALRNARWEKAFSEGRNDESSKNAVDRKATIVIEHLIQASDVAHTMQHWHVYRKWNERLFEEMYSAYMNGRAQKDPSEFWYKGELGFFDYYIIPLASKLKECGVFGVSSAEYLNYAEKNRKEWESRGEEVVSSMVEHLRAKLECNNDDAQEPGEIVVIPHPRFEV